MAKVQIGGQMPPLPNSDDMAERYGIEANHRPAAALSCSRVWRATRSRHAALDRLKLRAHCQGCLHLYFAPIGLAVFVDHLFGVTIPGASINPARSFGPALVAWDWGGTGYTGSVPASAPPWRAWVTGSRFLATSRKWSPNKPESPATVGGLFRARPIRLFPFLPFLR